MNYYDNWLNRQNISQALDQSLNQPLPNYNNRIAGTPAARNTPAGQSAQYATPAVQNTGGGWKQGYGNVAGAASAIPAAYVQGQEGVDNFSIDKFAGLKASGQGLMSGGAIGAIAGGVSAQLGQFGKINQNLKNLDTSVELTNTSATGAPVYQGAAYVQAQDNIKALNKGESSLKGGIDPANQLFAAVFGTKRKIREKKAALEASIKQGQQDFNKADVAFDESQARKIDYNRRRSRENRLYNLYSAPRYNYG